MFHRTLFLLALALAAATAQAASVEVVLHTREGRPVDDQVVYLRGVRTSPASSVRRHYAPQTTDRDGVVRFSDLPPGAYEVVLFQLRDADLLLPRQNPFTPGGLRAR